MPENGRTVVMRRKKTKARIIDIALEAGQGADGSEDACGPIAVAAALGLRHGVNWGVNLGANSAARGAGGQRLVIDHREQPPCLPT